jgi:hypothetical protein
VVGVASGDKAGHFGCARRGEQCVCALGSQPVRLSEAAVEVFEVAQSRQGRCPVDDCIGAGGDYRALHGRRVEEVGYDRFDAP